MMRVARGIFLSLTCVLSEVLFENDATVDFSGHDYGSSTGWVYSFTSASDVQWGRLLYKINNVDTSVDDGYVHVTFVEFENAVSHSSSGDVGTQNIRVVDSVGSTKMMRSTPSASVQHLLNIDTGSDGEVGVTTEYMYSWAADGWICLEWNTDASKQHAALYENGVQAFSVDTWTFQGNSQTHSYEIPSDLDLRIGMYTYNGIAVSGSFKDVIVSTTRVGCGAPSPTPSPPTPSPIPTPTPTPPPAPSPATCTTMEGQDCYGSDISNSEASSASECCHICGQTPGCAAWTWSQFDAMGQQNPTCYLKASCDTQQSCGTCTAGKVDPAPAPAPVPPSPAPAPVPSDYPGGGLGTCIELCPSAVYEICVNECVERCGGSLSLQV